LPIDMSSWNPIMELAIVQARADTDAGEVPVGAVIVVKRSIFQLASGRLGGGAPAVHDELAGDKTEDFQILASGRNRTRELKDASAHAEILALREAEKAAGDFRLDHLGGVVCVSTIEPCLMCLGALAHARIKRLVFGVRDEKFGGLFGRFGLAAHPYFSGWEITEGVMAEECAALLKNFFAAKRIF